MLDKKKHLGEGATETLTEIRTRLFSNGNTMFEGAFDAYNAYINEGRPTLQWTSRSGKKHDAGATFGSFYGRAQGNTGRDELDRFFDPQRQAEIASRAQEHATSQQANGAAG